MLRLQLKVRRLDEDILKNVRAQGAASERGKADLVEAKRAISDLAVKIRAIQDRASAAEGMVEELCRDIRTLDYAKKNLKATITTLNQLHMLGSCSSSLLSLLTCHLCVICSNGSGTASPAVPRSPVRTSSRARQSHQRPYAKPDALC